MAATLFADPSAAYVPVGVQLPTNFDTEGWSQPKLVCTDGRVNIWPHCFITPRQGRPGYWVQIGQPHQVHNVTHWRDYPDDPPTPLPIPVGPAEASTPQPAGHVA